MANTSSIREKVAQEIAALAPRLESELVDHLVDREVEKRTKSLVNVLDKLMTLESEAKKLGEDIVAYDETGKAISKMFSKKRIEERAKNRGRIQKHINAINKALEKNDYSDLNQLAAGKDTAESGTGNSEEASSDSTE